MEEPQEAPALVTDERTLRLEYPLVQTEDSGHAKLETTIRELVFRPLEIGMLDAADGEPGFPLLALEYGELARLVAALSAKPLELIRRLKGEDGQRAADIASEAFYPCVAGLIPIPPEPKGESTLELKMPVRFGSEVIHELVFHGPVEFGMLDGIPMAGARDWAQILRVLSKLTRMPPPKLAKIRAQDGAAAARIVLSYLRPYLAVRTGSSVSPGSATS